MPIRAQPRLDTQALGVPIVSAVPTDVYVTVLPFLRYRNAFFLSDLLPNTGTCTLPGFATTFGGDDPTTAGPADAFAAVHAHVTKLAPGNRAKVDRFALLDLSRFVALALSRLPFLLPTVDPLNPNDYTTPASSLLPQLTHKPLSLLGVPHTPPPHHQPVVDAIKARLATVLVGHPPAINVGLPPPERPVPIPLRPEHVPAAAQLIIAYTDGSLEEYADPHPRPAGCGAYFPHGFGGDERYGTSVSARLPVGQHSSTRSEAWGVLVALLAAPPGAWLHAYTDSQALVALARTQFPQPGRPPPNSRQRTRNKLAAECTVIRAVLKHRSLHLTLSWVKGHSKDKADPHKSGNDAADELARIGTTLNVSYINRDVLALCDTTHFLAFGQHTSGIDLLVQYPSNPNPHLFTSAPASHLFVPPPPLPNGAIVQIPVSISSRFSHNLEPQYVYADASNRTGPWITTITGFAPEKKKKKNQQKRKKKKRKKEPPSSLLLQHTHLAASLVSRGTLTYTFASLAFPPTFLPAHHGASPSCPSTDPPNPHAAAVAHPITPVALLGRHVATPTTTTAPLAPARGWPERPTPCPAGERARNGPTTMPAAPALVTSDPRSFIRPSGRCRAVGELILAAPVVDFHEAHPAQSERVCNNGHRAGDLHSSMEGNLQQARHLKFMTGGAPTRKYNHDRWAHRYPGGEWCSRCSTPAAPTTDDQDHWLTCPAGANDRSAAREAALDLLVTWIGGKTKASFPVRQRAGDIVNFFFAPNWGMFTACGLVSRSLIAELNPSRRRFVVPIPALVGGITRIMTKVLHESVWAAHESAVVTLYGNGEDRRLVDDEGRVTRTRSRKTQARGSRREYATTTNTYGASCVWDNRPKLANVRDPTLVSQPSPPFVPPPAPWPDVQPAPQPEHRLPVATRLPAHLPATERWSHAPIITCTTCLMPLSRHLTHHHLVHPSVPSTAGLACPPNHHDAGKFLADNTLAHHLVTGEPIPWVNS